MPLRTKRPGQTGGNTFLLEKDSFCWSEYERAGGGLRYLKRGREIQKEKGLALSVGIGKRLIYFAHLRRKRKTGDIFFCPHVSE